MNRVICQYCGYMQDYYFIVPVRCALCMEVIEVSKTIMIDPGHGGKDSGAVWGHAEEDDINLGISFLLRCELVKRDIDVLMTRERDQAVSLRERTDYANRMQVDLFISIHCDAFHRITASGMSVHVHPECSFTTLQTAGKIKRMLATHFPDHKDRGVRKSNFHVLRHTKMPAILVETEFLSNPETRKFLREPENQLGLAQAISRGIV